MRVNNNQWDMDNSPELVKCNGCELNISKNSQNKNECFIYMNNQESRIIKKRCENQMLKPYETLRNIINKNNIIKEFRRRRKR